MRKKHPALIKLGKRIRELRKTKGFSQEVSVIEKDDAGNIINRAKYPDEGGYCLTSFRPADNTRTGFILERSRFANDYLLFD